MTYQFKVGDKGKTKGGQNYRVICTDAKRVNYPIIALVWGVHLKDETVFSYDKSGENSAIGLGLLPPDPEILYTTYHSLYSKGGLGNAHSAALEAAKYSRGIGLTPLGVIKIDVMSHGNPKITFIPLEEIKYEWH